jgi:ribonuclease HII
VAQYIRENAVAWAVTYEDETAIDTMNILQATQSSMHASIHEVMRKLGETHNYYLLIDGNYFKPITKYDAIEKKFVNIPYSTIEQGDNKLAAIAAASILAKVARDAYIHELCAENPELSAHYGIDKNKGYGTRQHLAGIEAHGITQWHRKSFRRCY